MSLQQIINYDTPGNFTYDSDLIDVDAGGSGLAELADIRTAGFALFDNYSLGAANWGVGTLTRTLTGATISGEKLICSGGTVKYCTYNADNFGSVINETIVDLEATPDFDTNPGELVYLYHNGAPNQIQFYIQFLMI